MCLYAFNIRNNFNNYLDIDDMTLEKTSKTIEITHMAKFYSQNVVTIKRCQYKKAQLWLNGAR